MRVCRASWFVIALKSANFEKKRNEIQRGDGIGMGARAPIPIPSPLQFTVFFKLRGFQRDVKPTDATHSD